MRIAEIRDPNFFQRLVRKLMICEHGIEYQVVDDSGGDGGLDGFNRTTGDLHAFYCPEKPVVARFRQRFQDDLAKARQLRDEKQYPIKRFIFITPEALREPDQRMLRDLARDTGFEDGINMSAEHQVLIDYLEQHDLVETAGMSGQSDSLLFHYGRILPLGKRVLEGKDP